MQVCGGHVGGGTLVAENACSVLRPSARQRAEMYRNSDERRQMGGTAIGSGRRYWAFVLEGVDRCKGEAALRQPGEESGAVTSTSEWQSGKEA